MSNSSSQMEDPPINNLTAKTIKRTNDNKYRYYIKKFSRLSTPEVKKIANIPYNEMFYGRKQKAAKNVLKSRGMNRSRHNLPVFSIDKVILNELKQGKLDLSYFQKILGTTEENNDMEGQIVEAPTSPILRSDKSMTREEAIRTLKTIRQLLTLNLPKVGLSQSVRNSMIASIPSMFIAVASGPQMVIAIPLIIFVIISIEGVFVYKRYTSLELIKQIDSILNSIPMVYEKNPYLNISRKQNIRNKLKNEINANSQEISRLPNNVMPSRKRFNRGGRRRHTRKLN